MKKVIASIYEIEKEIGSGGGGIVYLANHMRLGKKVVLKADKRTIVKTKSEVLRKEVDVLKNLSHSYIPQVYDFFVEDDVVYTVMDFIDGDSLDKFIKNGTIFKQSDIIKWACQLLEALSYLHSRPPYGILHADIKPANIMLTEEGSIRLIDFNIALALGAEGAAKIGYSQLYASPEHYGHAFTPFRDKKVNERETEITEVINEDDDKTQVLTEGSFSKDSSNSKSSSSATAGKGRLLDKRSDIYSLGATLYHLFMGIPPKRPENPDEEIRQVYDGRISDAVRKILEKAMAYNPDDRYQTAEEMLYDFRHIHDRDFRSVRLKKAKRIVAAALAITFVTGGSITFGALKEKDRIKTAYVNIQRSESAFRKGDADKAVSYAIAALNKSEGDFVPAAQYALTNALGVYDLKDGYVRKSRLKLPIEPTKLKLSPDGEILAAICDYKLYLYDVKSGSEITSIQGEKSVLADVEFVDENTIAYASQKGILLYDIKAEKELWVGDKATDIAISADKKILVSVQKDENVAKIYEISNGKKIGQIDFGNKQRKKLTNDGFLDPKDSIFSLNRNGDKLAVSFADGSLKIFDVKKGKDFAEIYDKSDFKKFQGGFSGEEFAFSASGEKECIFSIIDMQSLESKGGFSADNPFYVDINEMGTYIAFEDVMVDLDGDNGEQKEMAYTEKDILSFSVDKEGSVFALSGNEYAIFDNNAKEVFRHTSESECDFIELGGSTCIVGSHSTPYVQILEKQDRSKHQVMEYDADYVHDEARVNTRGKSCMLYSYNQFRIYGKNKRIVADIKIPNADEVYDQQYRRTKQGDYLEVIYNDGKIDKYSADNGKLIDSKYEKPKDRSLKEEYFTDKYKIVSEIHGTPSVYDKESGDFICKLEEDGYMTYGNQVGEYIVTEYMTANGQRYAYLLDENLKKLAFLPNLCDIRGSELIFDYGHGYLRKSKIYSLQELKKIKK